MAPRFLTSPAGDKIEIISDDEMAERLGAGPVALRQLLKWSPVRPPILRALWNHGAYEDRQSGRATGMLAADAGLAGAQVTPVLASPAMEPCLERELNGRRTYWIRLVALPEKWLQFVEPPAVADEEPAAPEPADIEAGSVDSEELEAPGSDQLDAEPGEAGSDPAPALEVSHAVALSLLTQVVEIITAGRGDAHELSRMRLDVVDLSERLGGQVSESDKLRRQLRETGDELLALRQERDGLRQRLRIAEHNLTVATSGDVQRVIDTEVRKRLDTMMRQAPGDVRARANGA